MGVVDMVTSPRRRFSEPTREVIERSMRDNAVGLPLKHEYREVGKSTNNWNAHFSFSLQG